VGVSLVPRPSTFFSIWTSGSSIPCSFIHSATVSYSGCQVPGADLGPGDRAEDRH
jgi:hypothetical protein